MSMQDFNGFKLACNLPPIGRLSSLPKLKDAPGYRRWSKTEIQDFIKNKPKKMRRSQFNGKNWIVNQGQVGSCCAAASTGTLRRAMALNGANEVPMLNWEFLYAQINGGADNGAILEDANERLRDVGITLLHDNHKFNREIYKQHYKQADYEEAAKYKAEIIYEADNELDLASLVLSGQGSSVVAVHVGNNFNSFDSNGCAGASPSGPGNHAVIVQDAEIVNGTLLFDMVNSWGLDWGEEGHCYLTWDKHLATTTKYHKFFVVMSTDTVLINDKAPKVIT